MSGAGINPLALVAPDLYTKQIAIQRRQALAQALLEQGGADPGKAAYGGLRNAGNAILGAFLAKRADKDMAGLYAPPPDPSQQDLQSQTIQQHYGMSPSQASGIMNTPLPLSQQAQPEPQISNNPGSGPFMPQPQQAQAAQQQPQASQQAPQYVPQGQPRSIPQAMSGAIPDLPSMTHMQSMLEYFQDPQDYWKALAPTPEYRNALMAAGGDPAKAQQLLLAGLNKSGAVPTTRGMVTLADGTHIYAPPPAPPGYQYVDGQDGRPQLIPTQGGQQAVAGAALAQRVPTALTTPAIGYGSDNMPVATNALALSGNAGMAPQLGIGGRPAPQMQAPQMPAIPRQAPAQPMAGNTGGGMRPELPQGVPQYLQGQGKDAAERHDATVAAASESPMRINVLDNIIGLSQSGVNTGPGQDFQNKIAGLLANTPGLSMIVPQAQKDKLSNFQELQKFTYQNAIRSWQAAGGTGTDAQMESMAHANPNDALFPRALQTIAKWGKAAELAVQGKANAQDRFLAANGGNTPTNQIKFENSWRNAFDPKAFQYDLMTPPEKQAFAKQLGPAGARALISKMQQLKAMGAIP